MATATKAKTKGRPLLAGSRSKAPVKARARRNAVRAGDNDDKVRSDPLGLDVDGEVLEFIEALDRFKKSHGRPFPSWSEVLHVLRELGYRKS